MADIFLSYNEKDRERARRVAKLLAATGWSVWWDRRIPAGESWRSVLEQALQEMRCMIVLWTAHSIESDWVFEEASEGRRQDKLIPVMLEAVRPPAGFREIQAADLTAWDGTADSESWRLLVADLERRLGRPPGAEQPTTDEDEASDSTARKLDTKSDTQSDTGHDTKLDTPADDGGTRIAWPWRRALIWGLAGLLPLAGGIAYLRARQPNPPLEVARPAEPPPAASPTSPPSVKPTPPVPEATPPTPTEAKAPAVKPNAKLTEATRNTVAQPRPPVAVATRRSTSERCADLLARLQLGESLSAEAQAVLNKECSP